MALSNALLTRWSGGWLWVEDAASIAEHGRREAFLSLGQAASEAEAQRLAEAALATSAQPQVSVQTSIEPAGGDVPYDDFGVGDTVTVPDQRGRPSERRVLALTVTEDQEGNPTYVPELATVVEAQARRQARTLKRMANGTLGGASASASAVVPPVPRAQAQRPETAAWGDEVVGTGESPPWPWHTGGTLFLFVTTLTAAGTTDTVADLTLNGLVVATATILAGDLVGTPVQLAEAVAPLDLSTVQVTSAGSGASGFGAFAYKL